MQYSVRHRGEGTSCLRRGDTAIQRGEGGVDGGIARDRGCNERLDLGLQDAPRSTIYRDQTNRQK